MGTDKEWELWWKSPAWIKCSLNFEMGLIARYRTTFWDRPWMDIREKEIKNELAEMENPKATFRLTVNPTAWDTVDIGNYHISFIHPNKIWDYDENVYIWKTHRETIENLSQVLKLLWYPNTVAHDVERTFYSEHHERMVTTVWSEIYFSWELKKSLTHYIDSIS